MNFKVKCIKSDKDWFTAGEVYTAVDGKLVDNENYNWTKWATNGRTFESFMDWFKDNYPGIRFELVEDKKVFTKNDFKNGDLVKCDDGEIGVVILDRRVIMWVHGGKDKISILNHNLSFPDGTKVIAICRPFESWHCNFEAFDKQLGALVYERKEPEEMTLEEVCKVLGKEIKIVKSK